MTNQEPNINNKIKHQIQAIEYQISSDRHSIDELLSTEAEKQKLWGRLRRLRMTIAQLQPTRSTAPPKPMYAATNLEAKILYQVERLKTELPQGYAIEDIDYLENWARSGASNPDPKKPAPRKRIYTETIKLNLTPAQKEHIQTKANQAGMNINAYIRNKVGKIPIKRTRKNRQQQKNNRSITIESYLTPAEFNALKVEAEKRSTTISEYIRRSIFPGPPFVYIPEANSKQSNILNDIAYQLMSVGNNINQTVKTINELKLAGKDYSNLVIQEKDLIELEDQILKAVKTCRAIQRQLVTKDKK